MTLLGLLPGIVPELDHRNLRGLVKHQLYLGLWQAVRSQKCTRAETCWGRIRSWPAAGYMVPASFIFSKPKIEADWALLNVTRWKEMRLIIHSHDIPPKPTRRRRMATVSFLRGEPPTNADQPTKWDWRSEEIWSGVSFPAKTCGRFGKKSASVVSPTAATFYFYKSFQNTTSRQNCKLNRHDQNKS